MGLLCAEPKPETRGRDNVRRASSSPAYCPELEEPRRSVRCGPSAEMLHGLARSLTLSLRAGGGEDPTLMIGCALTALGNVEGRTFSSVLVGTRSSRACKIFWRSSLIS